MGRVVESQEVVSDEDLIRTEYYQDFSRKVDAFYAIGSIFPVSSSETAILAIHRPRTAGTHGAEAKELVGQFLPHLQRALQMRTRFAIAGIERQAALDGLERAGLATLVVERDGRIIYANSDAEMLLLANDGIRAFTGRLAVAGSAASSALTRLIREAVDTASSGNGETGAALPIPRDERLPLTALVPRFRPAPRGFGPPAPAAIIFIRDPEKPSISTAFLQDVFGLTPTEASIASQLADGKSIEEIAAAHHISLNTARTHLKAIYGKTGTNRQAQLVTLVLRSVTSLA